MTPEERAEEVIKELRLIYDKSVASHVLDQAFALAEITEALREAVEAERRACVNDVCMYCAHRAIGYEEAEGPNEAGNWTHKPKGGGAPLFCRASSIHARARFIARAKPTADTR